MSFLRFSNLHILIIFGVFVYILGMLIFNSNRGLDLTDESFYILNSIYPFDIFSVVTHENYYTGLLFYLSGYNLTIFRVFGIIVLLLSSIWFSIELYKYIEEKYQLDYDIYNKFYFILIISLSSLVYYMSWVLTPSYNWLSLVAMILIIASIFRCINNIKIIRGDLRNPTVRTIDLANIVALNDASLLLRPNDIIYVQPRDLKGYNKAFDEIMPFWNMISSILDPFVKRKQIMGTIND